MRTSKRTFHLINTHIFVFQFEVALLETFEEFFTSFTIEDVVILIDDVDDKHSWVVFAASKAFDLDNLYRPLEIIAFEINEPFVCDHYVPSLPSSESVTFECFSRKHYVFVLVKLIRDCGLVT